jgi:hypothetical protein
MSPCESSAAGTPGAVPLRGRVRRSPDRPKWGMPRGRPAPRVTIGLRRAEAPVRVPGRVRRPSATSRCSMTEHTDESPTAAAPGGAAAVCIHPTHPMHTRS